jgi:hypothetical protein
MFDSPTPILTYDFIAREEYVLGKSSPNKIRMFVPPGTIKINFYCWGVTRTIIRYNNVPESKEFKDVSYSTPGMVYGLSQLGVEDCFTIPEYVEEGYSGALNTYICRDDISTGLKVSDAGWLYADLEFDTYGKNCIFSLTVNIGLYNEWWDNAGSNDDKSINWDNDIEIVTTYISKSVDV